VVDDLGTPQVNIAYGAWYLRYLPARYGGEGHVDRWIAAARERREALTIDAIPGLRRPGARGARRVPALLRRRARRLSGTGPARSSRWRMRAGAAASNPRSALGARKSVVDCRSRPVERGGVPEE
jgi:hypothetical protein